MTLPDDFQGILEAAHGIGPELAASARDVDARTGDSREAYRVLRDAGFLRLIVPRRHGGAGLGFEQYWRVLAVLASYNGAAALGFNMHNAVIGPMCESADTPLPPMAEEFRTWFFDEIVRGGRMFASATSEPGSGAKLLGLRTTYRPTPDRSGFVITGRKSFVSLAGVADYYAVPARPEGNTDPGKISHFLVSPDDVGVTFGEVYDLSAMYGTSTAGMTLDDVEVPASRLFLGIEGMSLPRIIREPHWMVAGYTGAYLGIAEAIHRHVVEAVATTPSRAESPVVQRNLGYLSARLAAASALVHEAARSIDADRGSTETNARVHAAKYVVGELGADLVREAVATCGSAAVSRSKPLERLIREIQYCAVMPAKPDECLEYLGKAALGVKLHEEGAFTW
ncbi:acyl-CoA dehydrogenase family protein [Saccharothrix sp. Mg75]|uniref:acyl-CoA dehydrogenase family protein n=1 Tax=Saccharothrix sp. Mg75 TaxID=3445357 RepID=UPI003EECC8EE